MAKLTLNGVQDAPEAPPGRVDAAPAVESPAKPAPVADSAHVGAAQIVGAAAAKAHGFHAHAAFSALESVLHDLRIKLEAAEVHAKGDVKELLAKIKSLL